MWCQNCRVNIEVQTLLPREKSRPLVKGWGVGCLETTTIPLHYRLMHAIVQPALENDAFPGGVSAPEFAKMFGMTTTEAVVFLEWIKVGVKFKEEVLDGAKGLAL